MYVSPVARGDAQESGSVQIKYYSAWIYFLCRDVYRSLAGGILN